MADLAIKGHETRAEEIIEILTMMGGKNSARMTGDKTELVYYIEVDKSICCVDIECPAEFCKITLEEFLEKYPFKVGDLVQHNGATSCDSVYEVEEMQWDYKNNKVKYIVKQLGLGDIHRKFTITAEHLKPYKETTEEKKINQMSIANCDLDEVEIVLGDKFELVYREGKYYAVKKQPKYPKTYEHCCKIEGGIAPARHLQYDTTPWYQFEEDLRDSLENLRKLIICRNAYWRIAGDQMGLYKPWKPDSIEMNHAIVCRNDGSFLLHRRTRGILIFPTEEMRNAFFENFKHLIEACKEFL